VAAAIAAHLGAVPDAVVVAGILCSAKEMPRAVPVYAALVGLLCQNEATRPLALAVINAACAQLSPSLLVHTDRALLLLATLGWQCAGLAPAAWPLRVLQALAPADDAAKASEGGEAEHRALLCLWLAAQLRLADDERAALVARVAALKRPLRLDSAPLAADRADPDLDRLSFALVALKPTLAAFEPASLHWLARFAPSSVPASEGLLADAEAVVLRAPTSSDARVESLLRVPLFPGGQAPDASSSDAPLLERFLVLEAALELLHVHREQPAAAAKALGAGMPAYQVVEAVVSQLLCRRHGDAFCAHVLVELCMEQPDVYPAPVEDALDRLVALDIDLDWSSRASNWLVAHLAAFNLDWPWVKWARWTELGAPTQAFVAQTLQRLEGVMDTEPLVSAVPREITSRALQAAPALAPDETVLAKLRTKPSPEDVLAFAADAFPGPASARVLPLVTAAAHLGRVSFTHLRQALERVAPALVNEDVGDAFLEAVFACLPGRWAAVAAGVGVDCDVVSRAHALRWLLAQSTWPRLRAAEDVLARPGEPLSADELDAIVAEADAQGRLFLARRIRPF